MLCFYNYNQHFFIVAAACCCYYNTNITILNPNYISLL